MNNKIKLLLLTILGLGFISATAQATCDTCDQPEPPAEAGCPPGPPGGPSGSMPEDVIIDDVTSAADKPVAQTPGATAIIEVPSDSKLTDQ